MVPLKIGGIALASSIAGTIDFLILFYVINKRLGGLDAGLFVYFLKMALAGLLTAIFAFKVWGMAAFSNEFLNLIFVSVLCAFFYELVCLALNVEQAHKILGWMKNGKRET
jgi:peptidoglycan biosynthesis protein MviN/MurJ (putative lipid II flippase)